MTNSKVVATSVDGKVDLFGHVGQAKMYQEFRPKYTQALADSVLSMVPESQRGLYLDVACGSGQLTSLISPHFRRTLGVDKSFEQLAHAPAGKAGQIEYIAGSAFELPVEPASVDLVTVAQGLHWLLPYDQFFAEVDRVLRPGGTFVAVAYSFPQLVNARANLAPMNFYVNVLGARLSPGMEGCWWETNRPTIDCFYTDVPFPAGSVTSHLPQRVSVSLTNYINYLKTLSAYRTLVRSGEADPLPQVERDILAAVGSTDPETTQIEVDIPFFTVSFQKKQ